MIIDDVFFITGRRPVVMGAVQNEKLEIGQKVIVDPEYLPEFEAEIIGIEAFRKTLKSAKQNEYVGLLLKTLNGSQIKKKMKIYSA